MSKNNAMFNFCLFVFIFLIISSTCSAFSSISNYVLENEITKTTGQEASPSDETCEEDLKSQFEEVLKKVFLNRNACIQNLDAESLKASYNTHIKVSLWAYESEAQKIKYLTNWCDKQAIHFNHIESTLKIRKIKEKAPDTYNLLFFNSTEFTYHYIDTPNVLNHFRLGTSHYMTLKKEGSHFIITKEWYTDPFADSLNLEQLKTDEMRQYILNHKMPDFTLDERTQKAIDYAHMYCGVGTEKDCLFKYNQAYKNFNPDGGDCANFASQIMHEGGHFKKNRIWNYDSRQGTKAWVNAQAFKNYIVGSGRGSYIARGTYQEIYKQAYNLRPGDFVAYEKKGKIVHISTVTGLDSKGYPLVTCHNTDRLLVPYDLGWSNKGIRFHLINVHY